MARVSPTLHAAQAWGLFPAFQEKTQAGLRVVGRDGRTIYQMSVPERAYPDFDAIAPLVVRSLVRSGWDLSFRFDAGLHGQLVLAGFLDELTQPDYVGGAPLPRFSSTQRCGAVHGGSRNTGPCCDPARVRITK